MVKWVLNQRNILSEWQCVVCKPKSQQEHFICHNPERILGDGHGVWKTEGGQEPFDTEVTKPCFKSESLKPSNVQIKNKAFLLGSQSLTWCNKFHQEISCGLASAEDLELFSHHPTLDSRTPILCIFTIVCGCLNLIASIKSQTKHVCFPCAVLTLFVMASLATWTIRSSCHNPERIVGDGHGVWKTEGGQEPFDTKVTTLFQEWKFKA